MLEFRFATDARGAPLPKPVVMLVASTWDLKGASRVYSRDDDTGVWTAMIVAEDPPGVDFLPQIRSFAVHRDRVTGVDHVFAGQNPRGIFRGGYDAGVAGRIRWASASERDIASIDTRQFPGLRGRLRITSFAECDGRLYAAIGRQIYERIAGTSPRWRLVYTNPRPFRSESGLRGPTAVAAAGGGRSCLRRSKVRIVRINPRDGSETTEVELARFLASAMSSLLTTT